LEEDKDAEDGKAIGEDIDEGIEGDREDEVEGADNTGYGRTLLPPENTS
jgi:hypothetical protein